MRCLVTGAYGFIGGHVVRALQADGAEVVGAGRDLPLGRRLLPGIEWRSCDFNRDLTPEAWLPRLEGIEAVVNLVGILQSDGRDDARRIHATATTALFEACRRAGVRRLVHVSAMSAEAGMATPYAESRLAAEAHLAGIEDLSWLIVKPSLVLGGGSYGGSSVLRGLAGLPWLTPLPEGGRQTFQPLAMGDLATAIARLALSEAPARTTLYAAGPEVLSVAQVTAALRRWLGFPPVPAWAVPRWLLAPALLVGDLLGRIGTASALRSASLGQMGYTGQVDGGPFWRSAGIVPLSLEQALARQPAGVQDRMHARLFFARPLLQGALALFWVMTGIIALLPPPRAYAVRLLEQGGLSGGLAEAVVVGGGLIDIAIGLLLLSARHTRLAGALQLGLAGLYLVGGLLYRPDLYADPTGPMLKVLPIMAATVAVMAMAETR